MNLDSLKNTPDGQPFVNTDRLTIYVMRADNDQKVIGFEVILDGHQKTFKVKPSNKKGTNEILDAWKEVEKYIEKYL